MHHASHDSDEITVNRLKASTFKSKGGCDHTGDLEIIPYLDKCTKNSSKAIDSPNVFKEMTDIFSALDLLVKVAQMTVGRLETFSPISSSNMAEEIQSDFLPLLIKTSNHRCNHRYNYRNEHGSFKDCSN